MQNDILLRRKTNSNHLLFCFKYSCCSLMYWITLSAVRYLIDNPFKLHSLTFVELIWFGTSSSTNLILSMFSLKISSS
uniref:Uncharacterized protein n=1 Tax=Rhizophora mucronata TaxID=61149 RepID=A0A2P2M2E4_RHIMU